VRLPLSQKPRAEAYSVCAYFNKHRTTHASLQNPDPSGQV